MGPHIRGAEVLGGGDPLLGIIKFFFLMIHLKSVTVILIVILVAVTI